MPLILGAGENITYNTSPFYCYESNSNTSWFWLQASPPALVFEFVNVGGTIWAGPWVNAEAPTGMPWRNFASSDTWFDVVPNTANGTGRILCSATQSWNDFALLMNQDYNGRSTIDATYLGGSTNNILRMVMSVTEAARWGASDAGGYSNRGFFIGRTTSNFNGAEVLQVQSVDTTTPAAYFSLGTNPGSTYYNLVWFGFYTGNSGAWVTNSSAAYLAGISDHRRKVNVQPMTEGMSVIGRLRPVIYNWKDNPQDTDTHGFLAHEMYEVLPEAVRGEPFEVDDEGQPVYQMIDRIPVVPWLTAAVKQMIDRMETIEQRLTDLEPGAVR